MKKLFQRLSMLLAVLAMIVFSFSLTSCSDDDDDETTPPVVVLDGYYVKGAGTAFTDFNSKAMMKVTRNEVTQENRPTLLELYIPVKAGAEGFNIVQVSGSTRKTYGPGADFQLITQGTTDEPKVPFKRGSYMETNTPFTVDTNGMYHVVIDVELGKVVVAPVHWGIIGAATPAGWGGSTQLTESAFDLNTMTWTATGMELRGGDWKLRYSNGWKIELDTNLDLGGGKKGVKVNTNFGGSPTALVPGGDNIVNSDPGIYDVSLKYVLGTGYTLTMTKTAGLPLTNWNGVQVDAIGEGVSPDNPTATVDTSSWHWGYQMLADNGGVPVKTGDLYTWTWTNIIIEADKGFKVRTLNGVAPPGGIGANFDAGFSALNVAQSAPEIVDLDGNLKATVKGSYTITLKIDAANNDNKEIIITKNSKK